MSIEKNKPLLLIVGGAPFCGRSIIARKVATFKSMSHLSLDAVAHALEKVNPQLGLGQRGEDVWSVCDAVEPILIDQLRWLHELTVTDACFDK